jgi:THUMP domain-like
MDMSPPLPCGTRSVSDFAAHFRDSEREVEVELISLRGECKEATAWFGALVTCRRRATRLPENVTWTERDGPTDALAAAAPLGSIIYHPDPALLRAGLLDGFAVANGLARAGEGVDYLTSDQLVSTPFLSAYELRDVSSFDLRRVRQMLRAHNVGSLVIKVRGLRVTPEALRTQLRLRGSREATLIVIGSAHGARAVLAQPISTGGSMASSASGAAAAGASASAGAAAAAGTGAPSPSPLPSV